MAATVILRLRVLITAGALAASLAGCRDGAVTRPGLAPGSGPADHAGICAASEASNGIELCTELFPGSDKIRLPGDPSDTQRCGA
jgi:hypothetical protein